MIKIFIDQLLWLTLGCIGFATIDLIRARRKNKLGTSKLKKEKNELEGKDGFIISKNFQLNFKKSCENVVVIGPPGEHKTTSFFYTNLLSDHFPKSSIVITDPKGQLYKLTHKYQKLIGRKPILFEPLGNNAHYNLLAHCKDFTEVRQLAVNLLENAQLATSGNNKNSEWISMAAPLLTAALLKEKTIPDALDLIILNTEEELESKFLKASVEAKRQFAIFQTSLKSPGTVDSIRSTLATSLALYGDPNLIKNISTNDFSPEQLRKEPIALYIKYDSSKAKYLAPFLGTYFSQFIDKVMNAYKEGCLPVIFMLEELQNIGKIIGLESILAICREYDMPIMSCLQNTVKLNDIYGQYNAMTILNCFKTKCVLPSLSDIEALRYISELCGETQINILQSKGNTSKASRKLFTPDEIRRLSNNNRNSDDKVLIIAHNKLPFLDTQEVYYENEKYLNNVF